MGKLLFIAVGLCALMIVLVISVRGIGHILPVSESVNWWHLTDCSLPCWGGFVIGNTPELEVEGRLRGLFPPPKAAIQRDSWEGTTTLTVEVMSIASTEIHRVGTVTVWFPKQITSGIILRGDSLPTLGEVFALLGPPTCVVPVRRDPALSPNSVSANFLTLEYIDLVNNLTTEINVGPPAWTERIVYFQVLKISYASLCRNGIPWRGFSNAEMYRQRLSQTP